jgi:hypothetical protein
MAHIRRNQACPCRSGRKHKHCCLHIHERGIPFGAKEISLLEEIRKIQHIAFLKKEGFHELGVFILFSMGNGDAWVLESTEGDALQVAAAGQPLPHRIHEDRERIEVDWSHTFTLRERKLLLTGYESGQEQEILHAPTMQIQAALRRIKKYTPADLLQQIHLGADKSEQEQGLAV